MFDDLETETQRTEDEAGASKRRGSWAPLLSVIVWALLYFPFGSKPWGMPLAIAGAYSVFVFGLAFGQTFRDRDDFFGNADVLPYVAKLLIPHVVILAIITWGVSWWSRLEPALPIWMTTEGRKGSVWYWCGALALGGLGFLQGLWMARRLKRRFHEPEY
jgi:hypothetical protein